MPDLRRDKTTLEALAPYIRARQISVYLCGRKSPLTGLTVCTIFPYLLVARANNSTHLIPSEKIAFVRFMPDSEPGRDVNHPLYPHVRQKGEQPINGGREAPRGPRDYSKPGAQPT
jgi:hypothetical protein